MAPVDNEVIARATLPVFLLPTNTVLFPGVTVRVPISPSEAASAVSRLNNLAKSIQNLTDNGDVSDYDNSDTKTLVDSSSDSPIPITDDPTKSLGEIKSLHKLLNVKDQRSSFVTIAVVPRTTASSGSVTEGFLTSDFSKSLPSSTEATPETLKNLSYQNGVVGRFVRVERGLNGKFNAVIEGYNRIKVDHFVKIGGPETEARVSVFVDEAAPATSGVDDLSRISKFSIWPREELQKVEALKSTALEIIEYITEYTSKDSPGLAARPELLKTIVTMVRHSRTRRAAVILTDILSFVIPLEFQDKINLLSERHLSDRINTLNNAMKQFLKDAKASGKYEKADRKELTPQQREMLRQRLKVIKDEIDGKTASSKPGSGSGANSPGGRGFGGGARGAADGNEEDEEINELRKKLESLILPEDGRKIVTRELKRLKRMHPTQAEYQVCRTYLETLADIPWSLATSDNLNDNPVERARKILDDDHYGLEKVKKRLLEYLAVLHLKQQQNMAKKQIEISNTEKKVESTALVPYTPKAAENSNSEPEVHHITSKDDVLTLDKSPILLLVGPPGVGKTSLAKSVAHALGRKFHRISLGGVRDEAEIRGHRRTYVGAMPGLLAQSLRKVGVINPVILLDEIDKVSKSNFHGDPSAALLEVLDPEQNHTFTDHYINFPIDLSKTLFIATANNADDIPGPLLDRMETIYLEGYTYMDKQRIAQNYLIPKQIKNNGLENDQISITEDAVLKIATNYTREAGVRNLEREIGTVCRGKAVEFSKSVSEHKEHGFVKVVDTNDLQRYLGVEVFEDDMVDDEVDMYVDKGGERRRRHTYGVVNGLAYMGSGNGGLLMFEATKMPGHGGLKTTGQLGSVIAESAELSLSWVRANAFKLGITSSPEEDVLNNIDIHLHAPAGAVPKDGPSAGAAMTVTFVSLLSKRPVPCDIAMTGEMTLRGKILAVGGIREKLLGAHIAGIRKVLLPYHTRKVVEEEYGFVKEINLEIVYVKYIWDVFAQLWPEQEFPVVLDSHL